jgi:hypothetical protein
MMRPVMVRILIEAKTHWKINLAGSIEVLN